MKPLKKKTPNEPQNDCVMGSLCSVFLIALHLCAAHASISTVQGQIPPHTDSLW